MGEQETGSQSTVTWLRPEFRGREDELCSHADAALLAGVTRASVSNWARRHDGFPAPVMVVQSSTGYTVRRLIVRREFEVWWEHQRKKAPPETWQKAAQRRQKVPHVVVVDRIAEAEKRVAMLAQRVADLRQKLMVAEAELELTHLVLDSDRGLLEALIALGSPSGSPAAAEHVKELRCLSTPLQRHRDEACTSFRSSRIGTYD